MLVWLSLMPTSILPQEACPFTRARQPGKYDSDTTSRFCAEGASNEWDGKLTSPPIGHIYVSKENEIQGPVLMRGKKATKKELQKLQRRGSDPK